MILRIRRNSLSDPFLDLGSIFGGIVPQHPMDTVSLHAYLGRYSVTYLKVSVLVHDRAHIATLNPSAGVGPCTEPRDTLLLTTLVIVQGNP